MKFAPDAVNVLPNCPLDGEREMLGPCHTELHDGGVARASSKGTDIILGTRLRIVYSILIRFENVTSPSNHL